MTQEVCRGECGERCEWKSQHPGILVPNVAWRERAVHHSDEGAAANGDTIRHPPGLDASREYDTEAE